MGEKKLNSHLCRTDNLMTGKNYTVPVRLWERLQINERNFSFLLFIISLTIVLGKIYINYGKLNLNVLSC